jgi:DNA-binding IclR family transcriptional regulator
MNLNPIERKVLAALLPADDDFGFLSFRGIARRTRLNRKEIRRACRSLRRKGLATFSSGLWNDDGQVAGSGYAATKEGRVVSSAQCGEGESK